MRKTAYDRDEEAVKMFTIARYRNLILAISLVTLGAVCYAQPGRKEFLGEAHVDGAVDHDNIRVTGARGEFRAIQIRVDNAPVDFDRVVVHFGDGQSVPVQLKYRINPGRETRVIDLPGNRRIIQSVEFWYLRAHWGLDRFKVSLFELR